jgi:hypothetical protein
MDATYLATTASLDRHAAAQAWADRQFSENEYATNNSRIEKLILETLASTDRDPENANLILPCADMVLPLAPDADVVSAVQATAPEYAVCDYHGGEAGPVAGLLPVVAPPQIIAVALCGHCLGVLDAAYPNATFVFLDAIPDSPEGTDQ